MPQDWKGGPGRTGSRYIGEFVSGAGLAGLTIASICMGLAGCASTDPLPDPPPDHPASALAFEAPPPELPPTLALPDDGSTQLDLGTRF